MDPEPADAPSGDGAPSDDAHAATPDSSQRSDISGVGPAAPDAGDTFPVVGIGASAGGLQAFQDFFAALPAQPGMAFVLVQHLSPDHESTLAELIQTRTHLAVTQVTDHPRVEPDRVYVIPPGKHLEIDDGHLRLVDLRRERGRAAAVDHFFRTLAADMGDRAVCIVLSGTGSDGSLGLKAVKERGGLTMAQTVESAEYDGMPRSAIDTDLVDVTGTPAELAGRLVEIRDAAAQVALPASDVDPIPENDFQALQAIFAVVRKRTAHDFSQYKRSTILRRLARRLQVTGEPTLPAYAASLRARPGEVQALLRDFLISVTQFFRDPEAFEELARTTIPSLFEGKTASDQVRVWVAGCATGEEAYSVAMLLCEHLATLSDPPDLQVFATDIDEDALARAREGLYAPVAAADVPPERLQRFFDVEPGGVRVKPSLRQIVLFARHNLISDPPFSRLDLVTCRNVLIYLNSDIQERVFATFHYALRTDGLLFLGAAESPDTRSKGFAIVAKRARLFRRRETGGRPRPTTFSEGDGSRSPRLPMRVRPADPPREGLVERYRDWTLSQYAPARLLVDEHYDVTHVFGAAGEYLRDREGPVTQNVVDKVLRAFRLDLRAALFRAFSKGEPTDTRFQRVEVGGRTRIVRLHVGLVGGLAEGEGIGEVVFIELDPVSVEGLTQVVPSTDDPDRDRAAGDVARMDEELRLVRSRLMTTIEEAESSNEELKASNEELQSINEELQSATEELETSQEELQSTNEELTTVNQELRTKLDELLRTNSDLQNLIASTDVGTLFLDRSLALMRYTPRAVDVFNAIPSDVGRPFAHLSHHLLAGDLEADARRVLETLVPEEREVESDTGASFLVRLAPYRTVDDRIDGVVLTFVDVTDLRHARDEARRRSAQQAVVAQLGQSALEGGPLGALFQQACKLVATCLDADYAKVLRHRPEAHDLFLEAGTGWHAGLVGQASVPDDGGSQGGYTLTAQAPVVVPDLTAETRFQGPLLLTSHGVRSGLSVPIPGADGRTFGVLGIHSRRLQNFSDDDAQFVVSVAHLLSEAIRREGSEGQIRAHASELEAVYATAPVGLAALDRDLCVVRANDRLAVTAEAPPVGQPLRVLVPGVADRLEPLLRSALASGEAGDDVEVASAETPPRVWLCSYAPLRAPGGDVTGISLAMRDITDRREAQQQLTDTLRRLDFVLDGARVGVWSVDADTRLVRFDARAQALSGMPATIPYGDATGRIHPDDQAALRVMDETLASGDAAEAMAFEVRARVSDGWRWLAVRGQHDPSAGPSGGLSGILFDVSTLREVQDDLRRLTADLEARVDARTAQVRRLAVDLTRAEQDERQRIGQILHDDLQQILYALQLKLELLTRVTPDDPRWPDLHRGAHSLLDQAIQSSRSLTVDLSPPILQDEGFERSLEWVASRMREAQGLMVEVESPPDVRLGADVHVLLVRVVRELLFNVVKHAQTDRATVRIATAEGRIRIEVADAGAGFDPGRLDGSASGFGLFSARERLRMVGGDLTIASAPGAGTTITVESPTEM